MNSTVTLTLKDEKGKTSRMTFNAQGTQEEVTNLAQEVARRADICIGGVISKITVTVDVPVPAGVKTAAATDSDVEEKLKFNFRTYQNKPTMITIPTWRADLTAALLMSKERSPDYLNDDVNALKNLLVAADLEGFVALTDKRGHYIEKLAKSRFVFKK